MTAPPPRRRWVRAASLAAVAGAVVAAACVVPSPNTVSGPEAPGAAPRTAVTATNAPLPTPEPRPEPPEVVDAGQTFFEFQVEEPVAPVNNVTPTYPSMLQSQGIGGQVIAQFVVDTLGRPDTATFKAIESSHELFTVAVRNALPRMQFSAAEIGGRKVKQLVQQAFAFRVAEPLRAPGAPPQSDTVAPRASVMTPLARGDGSATLRRGERPAVASKGEFFEFQIDEPARLVNRVVPTYPAGLKSEGVSGQVIAQFVVDTTGLPEMSSFKVVEATRPEFADAVRAAVGRMRYTPARVQGRVVRQLVQQSFSFSPDR